MQLLPKSVGGGSGSSAAVRASKSISQVSQDFTTRGRAGTPLPQCRAVPCGLPWAAFNNSPPPASPWSSRTIIHWEGLAPCSVRCVMPPEATYPLGVLIHLGPSRTRVSFSKPPKMSGRHRCHYFGWGASRGCQMSALIHNRNSPVPHFVLPFWHGGPFVVVVGWPGSGASLLGGWRGRAAGCCTS